MIGRSYNGPFDHSFGESPVKSDGGDNDYKSDNIDVVRTQLISSIMLFLWIDAPFCLAVSDDIRKTRSIAITRTVDAV